MQDLWISVPVNARQVEQEVGMSGLCDSANPLHDHRWVGTWFGVVICVLKKKPGLPHAHTLWGNVARSQKAAAQENVEELKQLVYDLHHHVMDLEKNQGMDKEQKETIVSQISNLEVEVSYLQERVSNSWWQTFLKFLLPGLFSFDLL